MLITYDPEVQGRNLSEKELEYLQNLKPDCTSFSLDSPVLTKEYVNKIKKAPKGKLGILLKKSTKA